MRLILGLIVSFAATGIASGQGTTQDCIDHCVGKCDAGDTECSDGCTLQCGPGTLCEPQRHPDGTYVRRNGSIIYACSGPPPMASMALRGASPKAIPQPSYQPSYQPSQCSSQCYQPCSQSCCQTSCCDQRSGRRQYRGRRSRRLCR